MMHSWQSPLTIRLNSRDPDSVIDDPNHPRFHDDILWGPSILSRGYDNTSVSFTVPQVVYIHGTAPLRPRTFDSAAWWRHVNGMFLRALAEIRHKPASDEKKARRAANRAAKHGDRTARMQRDAARKAQQHRARRH
jgi:hypothetical protein